MGLTTIVPIDIMDLDALIQRAKEKDPNAFDIIYRTYYPKMAGICMNIIKEDKATVDDLVHDAFIMAFVSIGSLRDNSKLGEWLTSIVRNVALKHVEQRKRLRTLSLSAVNSEEAAFIDSSASPDADLSHKELLELISLLPEGYSKILRLSVIDGFSHKEIADMLGIEPHSSSSQLSRARRLLKRIINSRIAGMIVILLLPSTWYLLFRQEKDKGAEKEIVSIKHGKQSETDTRNNLAEQQENAENSHETQHRAPTSAGNILTVHYDITPSSSGTDSVAVTPQHDISGDIIISERTNDSLDTSNQKSATRDITLPEDDIAVRSRKKKWQFLAAGSLGPALAQNAYKLIAVNRSCSSDIDSEWTDTPIHTSTWEELHQILSANASAITSADTLAMMEIASHNAGKIEQKEHHDQPVTFGISITKSIAKNWALETGLQYSILNSQFYLGENGYSVIDKQKVHYLGIPLRASYTWMNHKRLSAYSSAGVTMHIPVYGKVKSNYVVNWQDAYSESRHFTPSLQWQTGVSLGLQYKFAPNANLFVEPTFNWFIPSGNDTHTTWTEHPFMFTCPFGIRITW